MQRVYPSSLIAPGKGAMKTAGDTKN